MMKRKVCACVAVYFAEAW